MTKKRSALAVLLAALMVFALFPVTARADENLLLSRSNCYYEHTGKGGNKLTVECLIPDQNKQISDISLKSSRKSVFKIGKMGETSYVVKSDDYNEELGEYNSYADLEWAGTAKKPGKSVLTLKYKINGKAYTKKFNVYVYNPTDPFSKFKVKGGGRLTAKSPGFIGIKGKKARISYKLRKKWKLSEVLVYDSYGVPSKVSSSLFKSGKTIDRTYHVVFQNKKNKNLRTMVDVVMD